MCKPLGGMSSAATWSASLDTGTLTMDASTDADKQAWRSLLSHLHPATISLHADEALRLLRADVAHADATLAALVDGSAKCGLVSSMLVRVYDRASALGDARWLGDAFARVCAGTLQPLAGSAANVPPGHARAAAALWGALVRGGVAMNAGAPDALAFAGDFERLASTRTEDAVLSAGLARTLRYGGDITVEVWPEQRDAAAEVKRKTAASPAPAPETPAPPDARTSLESTPPRASASKPPLPPKTKTPPRRPGADGGNGARKPAPPAPPALAEDAAGHAAVELGERAESVDGNSDDEIDAWLAE